MTQAISAIGFSGLQQASKLCTSQNAPKTSTNQFQMAFCSHTTTNLHSMAESINECNKISNSKLEEDGKKLVEYLDKNVKNNETTTLPYMIILKEIATGKIKFPENGNLTRTVKTPQGQITYSFNSVNGTTFVKPVSVKNKNKSVKVNPLLLRINPHFNTELLKNLPAYYAKYHK